MHPAIELTGTQGPVLQNRLDHYVDRNISDMIHRLDSYTSARAMDIRELRGGGSYRPNRRRMLTSYGKCYDSRKGYREGRYGLLIAMFAALYPILSYLKATLEES